MGQSPESSDVTDDGTLPFIQGNAEFSERHPIPKKFCDAAPRRAIPGDLLISVRAPVGAINEADQEIGIGRGLCSVRFGPGIDPRFGWYAVHSTIEKLNEDAAGSTFEAVNKDRVGGLPIPRPSLSEQRRIADYLDRETARIDAIITARRNFLDLAAERKRALIEKAVTQGFSPSALKHDAAIPELAPYPAHWKVLRNRRLFQVRDEVSVTGREELLTVSHKTGTTRRSEKDVNMFLAETMDGYKIAHEGDLVINTMWAWMGAAGISPCHGIVSPAYHVYVLSDELHAPFVDLLIRTPYYSAYMNARSSGVWKSRLRLYPMDFLEMFMAVPPVKEQQEIVAQLEKNLKQQESLQTLAEQSITLLQERKQALIISALSGELRIAAEVRAMA